MGYNIEHITITVRLSAHNSEQDEQDREAFENLKSEIDTLIWLNTDYARIAGRN